jgi:hypothetical protein
MPDPVSLRNQPPRPPGGEVNRRSFLRTSAVLASGLAALAASLSPLRELSDFTSVEQWMQKYYKELTPAEMAKVLKRIENEVEKQYGLRPHVRDLKPIWPPTDHNITWPPARLLGDDDINVIATNLIRAPTLPRR